MPRSLKLAHGFPLALLTAICLIDSPVHRLALALLLLLTVATLEYDIIRWVRIAELEEYRRMVMLTRERLRRQKRNGE